MYTLQAVRTSCAQRFFYFKAGKWNNILNKKCNIVNTSKFELKTKLFYYFNTLNYLIDLKLKILFLAIH